MSDTAKTKPKRTSPIKKAPAILQPPRVYGYSDYRKFLSDWLNHRKTLQPNYSGAVFARKAGIAAHTLLGMVMRAERNLGYESIRSFVQALDLNGREAVYFEKLVLFNQSKKPNDKAYYLEQLHGVAQGEGRKIVTRIKNHAKYLSFWYVVAIRELVATEGFKTDPQWIASRLKNEITKKQAAEAWDLLIELGMVETTRDANGKSQYQIVSPALDIDPGHVDFAVRSYHKSFWERTGRAIENEDINERELSSMTMPVTDEDLPKLREKIREFRKKLNLEFPASKNTKPRHVVAINTQMLILSDLKEKGAPRK